MKKIIITGAAGFIGSHLGNTLKMYGNDVIGFDIVKDTERPVDFQLFNTNFINITAEHLKDTDVIFHLAAHINVDDSIESPRRYMENNTMNTLHLLEKLHSLNWKGKFIYASSAEVYGSAQSETISESHVLNPMSPYAVSKLAAENLCKNYADMHGLNVVIVRNFNTFGEFQGDGIYGGVIAKFARLAKNGEDLPVYGSGQQSRDYMYIEQAVNGYMLAMENAFMPQIVNFGSGVEIKIIDIAEKIAKEFNVGILYKKKRPNEVQRLQADINLASKHGYMVETDFWLNLEDYLQFIKDN